MSDRDRAATRAISAGNARIYTATICKSAADCEKIASREVNTAATRLKSACNGDVASSFESNITPRSGDRIQRNVPSRLQNHRPACCRNRSHSDAIARSNTPRSKKCLACGDIRRQIRSIRQSRNARSQN